MEEGEISPAPDRTSLSDWPRDSPNETPIDPSGATHSKSIEWPGDVEETSERLPEGALYSHAGSPSPSSSLRLLVQHSPVLRRQHKLAVLDGFSEIQIGRDIALAGSPTARIRLKELEVSKLHATLYWDQDRSQWSIVDMGSKHGTFIQSSAESLATDADAHSAGVKGTRLSAPRVASMPRTLCHLDRLTIGGTVFVVHIHENCIPCASCIPQSEEEIPLFLHWAEDGKAPTSKKRKPEVELAEPTSVRPRDPKKALALLKRSLLSSQTPTSSSSGSRPQPYIDRSARRRALHPDHASPARPNERPRIPSPVPSVPVTPLPPAPLSSTNIGHRLLMKQGWQPGTSLGEQSSERSGLVAPIDPPTTVGRAGIGTPVRLATSTALSHEGGSSSWRDAGKQRRWDEMHSPGSGKNGGG